MAHFYNNIRTISETRDYEVEFNHNKDCEYSEVIQWHDTQLTR
jgi:hypothetical protein